MLKRCPELRSELPVGDQNKPDHQLVVPFIRGAHFSRPGDIML